MKESVKMFNKGLYASAILAAKEEGDNVMLVNALFEQALLVPDDPFDLLEQAQAICEQNSLEETPNRNITIMAPRIYFLLGMGSSAIIDAQHIAEELSNDSLAWYSAGWLLYKDEQWEEADIALHRAWVYANNNNPLLFGRIALCRAWVAFKLTELGNATSWCDAAQKHLSRANLGRANADLDQLRELNDAICG